MKFLDHEIPCDNFHKKLMIHELNQLKTNYFHGPWNSFFMKFVGHEIPCDEFDGKLIACEINELKN